jgi:uncharacterized protein YjdB
MRSKRLRKSARVVLLVGIAVGAATCSDEHITDANAGAVPVRMDVVSGDNQNGLPGEQLPEPVVVRVTSATGAPVSGQIVNFRVVDGGGSVYAGAALTNADGQAQEWWTLGAAEGSNSLEARAVDSETGEKLVFATFQANATTEQAVASVTVTPSSAGMEVGETVQLQATARDASGQTLSGRSVSWSSSNTAVTTVDSDGLVTGIGAGSATITASSEGQNGTASVTVTSPSGGGGGGGSGGIAINECAQPQPEWIWCDDFEQNRLGSYFEYDPSNGSFERLSGVGAEGSTGMRARFASGQVSAGSMKLAFGRTPTSYMRPVDAGNQNYREIYWRMYVQNAPGWSGGGGDKLARGIVFANSNWAEAAIAHVWSGGSGHNYLVVDPASGTNTQGNLQTTSYNDFDNMRWLGSETGSTPIFRSDNVGQWRCVEVRMRLNDAGQTNGVFELWIDGTLDARRTSLNWLGAYDDYGINAIFFENYWNDGSPQQQSRFFDNIVVSTQRVGCAGQSGGGGGGGGGSDDEVASVAVTPSAAATNVGNTQQFSAVARNADGDAISGKTFTWSSSNASVATVNGTGLTSAQAPGTATISATVEGESGSATLTVQQREVETVSISPASATAEVGETRQFAATARDADGNVISGRTVTWASSNSSVATISSSGLATAEGAGSTAITATVDGTSGTASLSVAQPSAESVTISPASSSLTEGATQQFTATARDASGDAIPGKTFSWATSDSDVATVNNSGLVTAQGAGSATITATTDGESGQAAVTVTSGGGGGGNGVPPLVLEDFSTYTSTSNLLADPRDIYVGGSEDINSNRIALDRSLGFDGSSQSMRYDYPALGSVNRDYTISRSLDLENENVNELWVEIAFRFSPNWSIDAGASGGEAFKLLHVLVSLSSGSRFGLEFENGNGGTLNAKGPGDMYIRGSGSARTTALFDGDWHVARFHVRAGSNGMMELWVDGDYQGSQTGSAGSNRLYWVRLASNLNQGPVEAQSMWWGSVKVWDRDPGW